MAAALIEHGLHPQTCGSLSTCGSSAASASVVGQEYPSRGHIRTFSVDVGSELEQPLVPHPRGLPVAPAKERKRLGATFSDASNSTDAAFGWPVARSISPSISRIGERRFSIAMCF